MEDGKRRGRSEKEVKEQLKSVRTGWKDSDQSSMTVILSLGF